MWPRTNRYQVAIVMSLVVVAGDAVIGTLVTDLLVLAWMPIAGLVVRYAARLELGGRGAPRILMRAVNAASIVITGACVVVAAAHLGWGAPAVTRAAQLSFYAAMGFMVLAWVAPRLVLLPARRPRNLWVVLREHYDLSNTLLANGPAWTRSDPGFRARIDALEAFRDQETSELIDATRAYLLGTPEEAWAANDWLAEHSSALHRTLGGWPTWMDRAQADRAVIMARLAEEAAAKAPEPA